MTTYFSMDFLDYMPGRMGFGPKWRKWIRACIEITSFSLTVIRLAISGAQKA